MPQLFVCLGPDLPASCQDLTLNRTPNGKGVIVTGCSPQQRIYKAEWTADDTTLEWTTMTQELKYPRGEHAAMYVPNHMVNCHTGKIYLQSNVKF